MSYIAFILRLNEWHVFYPIRGFMELKQWMYEELSDMLLIHTKFSEKRVGVVEYHWSFYECINL